LEQQQEREGYFTRRIVGAKSRKRWRNRIAEKEFLEQQQEIEGGFAMRTTGAREKQKHKYKYK